MPHSCNNTQHTKTTLLIKGLNEMTVVYKKMLQESSFTWLLLDWRLQNFRTCFEYKLFCFYLLTRFWLMISNEKWEKLTNRREKLQITEADLIEKFILGSGKGGQKLQKTSSTVYLKHWVALHKRGKCELATWFLTINQVSMFKSKKNIYRLIL